MQSFAINFESILKIATIFMRQNVSNGDVPIIRLQRRNLLLNQKIVLVEAQHEVPPTSRVTSQVRESRPIQPPKTVELAEILVIIWGGG